MIDGHRETWPVRSLRLRSWLRSALDALEAQAQFDAPRRSIYLRVAEQKGRLSYDWSMPRQMKIFSMIATFLLPNRQLRFKVVHGGHRHGSHYDVTLLARDWDLPLVVARLEGRITMAKTRPALSSHRPRTCTGGVADDKPAFRADTESSYPHLTQKCL
jgi:hypothetical protein